MQKFRLLLLAILCTTFGYSQLANYASESALTSTVTFGQPEFGVEAVTPGTLYSNGPYFNVAGSPDISLLETSLGMTTLGAGNQLAALNRVADDWVVTSEVNVDNIQFYSYQTGSTTVSTINHVSLAIWDGDPANPSSTIIWGDQTTNVFSSSEWTGAYRRADTSPGDTSRPIMVTTVNTPGLTLQPGTYWLDWNCGGTLASGPWAPPIAITGQSTTGNAKQSLAGAAWTNLVDVGPQGLPFEVNGTEVGEPGGGDCEQGVPSQSVVPQAFGILSSNPYRSAEDFTVEAEGFTLQQITIDTNQQSVPNAATIYIRSDVGGVPGAILHTITGAPDNSEVVGSAFGDPIIQLTFDLDTQIDLPEGTYWLDPNMTTAVSGEVVWWAADDYDSSHGANIQRSSDGGTTWTVDTDYSGVFTVSGICGDEEPGGTECDITYSGSLEDGLGNLALLTLASDFTIGADESMSVEKVTFNVFANVASVNVSFHANNAGTPGAQIVAPMSIVPTSQTLIGTSPTGSNIYEVVLDLPTAQEFEGGASGTNYWMAISTVMGSEGLGNYWEFSDSINNGTNFFYSLDGGVVWADAGPAGFVEDGAFILEGICGGDEPPTGEDCGQGDDSNGFENGYQIGSGTDFENADDFFVSAGNTLNVQTIELNAISMAGPMESIGFTFYEDNAGAPGSTVVQTVTGLVPYEQFVIGSAFGFDVYAIYVDVDLDFAGGASGTTYWMQPTAVAPGGEIGGYFWEITTAGSLGSPVHTRELAGAWTPNTGENAVFKLHCDDVVPPPPPCVFDITLDIEPITRVDVADIDHTSDATVNGSPALEDFTAVVGNMAPGESYDIALEGNTAGDFTTFFTVFIDWNQDGDWTDADEMYEIGSITNSTGTDGQQATGTIAVPAGAPEGTTVMRVIKNFNVSPTNPCGTYSFGQGEDYTINVGEVPPGGEECNQEVLSNALENGLFLGGADNQRLAVDVTVAANTRMTISAIEPTIIVPEGSAATTFGFVFYEDLGGLPGAEIDNATGTITSSTVTGQNFGRDFIRYAVDLDAPVILEAGTYWMEMTSDAEGWESTTASVLGSTLVFNNASTSGEWVNDGTGMEMVYEIVATCETLGVSDMDSFDFAYYPNPVKDVLNITSNKKVENVAVYNLAGQQVLANAKVNNGQINISALSTGVYVFRATLQGGQVETFKIIKK